MVSEKHRLVTQLTPFFYFLVNFIFERNQNKLIVKKYLNVLVLKKTNFT